MGESEITPLSVDRTGLSEPTSIAGRYTVMEKLGQGGMGRVYSAHDSVLDRTVAIKILFGTNIPQDYWKRFQMEAKAASKLKHPSIVQVLDFGVFDDDQPFLVMEYMKGKTLEDLLAEEGRLPLKDAISIVEQVCIGMEHAHNQQVLHRDLKPSNIMISRDEEDYSVHILDFGVAKVVDQVSPQETLTRTGQIVGSPRCMSPEQASGEVLDRRSDIYSLGCVAFELLSGKPPFLGRTALETIAQHMFDPVPSVDPEGLLGVPEYLAAAVERALAKSPADRYGTMAEFAQEIAGCAALINEAERLKQLEEEEDAKDEASAVDAGRLKLSAPLVISVVLVLAAIFLVGTWYALTPRTSNSKRIKAAKVRIKKQKREKLHDLGYQMANFGEEEKLFSNPKIVLSSWVSISPDTTEAEKEEIFKDKPKTDTFNINNVPVDEKLVDYMAQFPKFRKLRLAETTISPGALKKLSRIKRFSQIQFLKCELPVAVLKQIAGMPGVGILEFQRTPLTSLHMQALSSAKQLKLIRFKFISNLMVDDFFYLKDLKNTVIELTDCKGFNNDEIEHIRLKYGLNKVGSSNLHELEH